MSKITKATFKSFIKRNQGNLQIKVTSDYDPQVDGRVPYHGQEFSPATATTEWMENSLGVKGVYLVGGSRNYFTPYEQDGYSGIRWSNCCGSGVLAVKL